ncbi:coiled-coil domain-containing protein 69 [Notolabrus celidotus]|uniref:coiled-coil domain-containing protein 69 n=1 Tax=Notolabrus celidotus TaxID=1203425 RepID=UPI00148FCA16|nr:coiled-coil domain-containing protein 69 [Notolabrus celidotus]
MLHTHKLTSNRQVCRYDSRAAPSGVQLKLFFFLCFCRLQKKSKGKKGGKHQKDNNHQDEGGKRASGEQDVCLEKQLERFEWQLRILKEVLSANGNPERAELLKDHADVEVCGLVLSILDKERTETTADLNTLHEQKSKAATEEHERSLEELQKKHEEEQSELTEKFQTTENDLKGEVTQLTADLQVYNELKRRVQESTFKKDLQRNIQAHGSPGAFWESEQESLVFVIEMKSQRVQEQSKKLQQMDALVEKNLALEDQIIHVLQQNEDLNVRIENCQTLIQQLSKEQQDLKVALERQAVTNQNLSQEKEQLMFKLRHRDSCPTIHLPAMMQEISPR